MDVNLPWHSIVCYDDDVNFLIFKAKYLSGRKNACSMDVPPSVSNIPGMVSVAASNDDFQSSLGCGVCLKISGNGKPATADLDGAPPVKGILNGIVVDQDDTLSQGTTSTVNTLCQGSSHLLEFFF